MANASGLSSMTLFRVTPDLSTSAIRVRYAWVNDLAEISPDFIMPCKSGIVASSRANDLTGAVSGAGDASARPPESAGIATVPAAVATDFSKLRRDSPSPEPSVKEEDLRDKSASWKPPMHRSTELYRPVPRRRRMNGAR